MNLYFVLILGLLFYFGVPFITIVFIKNKIIKNTIVALLSVLFIGVLFLGIYGKVVFSNSEVFVYLDFSKQWFNKTVNFNLTHITTFDFVVNLVMLIPVGIVCRYLMQNKKTSTRIIVLVLVATISGILTELGQYILPISRSVQLSDSLLNMISVLIGGGIASIFYLIKNKLNR